MRFKSALFRGQCAGCFRGQSVEVHDKKHEFKEWTSGECTREVETKYYGEHKFSGSKSKTAKVEISY